MTKGAYKLYQAERDKGLTYREIAKKYGVSYQNVCQACSRFNPKQFRFHGETAVIYPNLRKWMNDNKISIAELVRRLGLSPVSNNITTVSSILKGGSHLRKHQIDNLISVTGMTYEELFAV